MFCALIKTLCACSSVFQGDMSVSFSVPLINCDESMCGGLPIPDMECLERPWHMGTVIGRGWVGAGQFLFLFHVSMSTIFRHGLAKNECLDCIRSQSLWLWLEQVSLLVWKSFSCLGLISQPADICLSIMDLALACHMLWNSECNQWPVGRRCAAGSSTEEIGTCLLEIYLGPLAGLGRE